MEEIYDFLEDYRDTWFPPIKGQLFDTDRGRFKVCEVDPEENLIAIQRSPNRSGKSHTMSITAFRKMEDKIIYRGDLMKIPQTKYPPEQLRQMKEDGEAAWKKVKYAPHKKKGSWFW